jgi:hypothetical protein
VAFAVHLQDVANRYRLHCNPQGIPWHIFLDDLAAKDELGYPNYADPHVFPVLWDETVRR